MGDPSADGQLASRRRVRREYVIGAEDGCGHPLARRTFHGLQASTAFYQCQQCGAVIVVPAGEPGTAASSVDP